jgi:hypothetical protein
MIEKALKTQLVLVQPSDAHIFASSLGKQMIAL